jgi:hypothetical protein
MSGIDLHRVRYTRLTSQAAENSIKNPQTAPSHKAVVEGFVRAIVAWRITPPEAISDHMNDPRYHLAIIASGYSMSQREIGTHQRKLTIRQPEQIRHGKPPVLASLESDLRQFEKTLINRS